MPVRGSLRKASLLIALLFALSAGDAMAAMPYHGWLQFDFPGFSSLHDCDRLEFEGSDPRRDCRITLEALAAESLEPGLAEDYRKQLGHYGKHPLLFVGAELQHCDGELCTPAHDTRVGPPIGMWRAPVVQNLGSHLLYHLPAGAHSSQHRLVLHGLDQDWVSDRFPSCFHRNYLVVQFDRHNPGHLIVQQDWIASLGDATNYESLWNDNFALVMLWLTLMFLALPGAMLASNGKRRMRSAAALMLAHGMVMACTIALYMALMPYDSGNTMALLAALLAYLLSALPEYPSVRRFTTLENKQAWRALRAMRLPFAIVLAGLLLLH